jgi:hypothetical protein
MAKKPESGIKLLDQERKYCVTCAEGKQTKSSHQKRDTGANSPIDQPGGVICSDIKGPMSPPNRFDNRYMVVFVDHYSNYTRVFLAKEKNFAADKFQRTEPNQSLANGKAERMHRTLVDMARSMLFNSTFLGVSTPVCMLCAQQGTHKLKFWSKIAN